MKDLSGAINQLISSVLDDVHTCLPGKIVKYDEGQRKATVKVLTKLINTQNKVIDVPEIDDVPVVFPSSKKFKFTFPLENGDGVLLLFSETSLGNYLTGTGIVEADDSTQFNLNDCIALPGLYSFTSVTQANNAQNYIEVTKAGGINVKGTSAIDIKSSGTITINNNLTIDP